MVLIDKHWSNKIISCVFFVQVCRILYSFSTVFKRSSKAASEIRDSPLPQSPDSDIFTFTVSLEVREDDGKGNFRSELLMRNHLLCSFIGFFSPKTMSASCWLKSVLLVILILNTRRSLRPQTLLPQRKMCWWG